MKKQINSIRGTKQYKVFIELLFWGAMGALWTLVAEMLTSYSDFLVYAGYIAAFLLITFIILKLNKYYNQLKPKTNENNS